MTIDTDLATLRNPWGLMPDVVTAAADRVEAELSRLRHAESQARYYREKYEERAEELSIELARLREGLRPESLARFWWWWLVLGFMLGTLFGYGLAVAS